MHSLKTAHFGSFFYVWPPSSPGREKYKTPSRAHGCLRRAGKREPTADYTLMWIRKRFVTYRLAARDPHVRVTPIGKASALSRSGTLKCLNFGSQNRNSAKPGIQTPRIGLEKSVIFRALGFSCDHDNHEQGHPDSSTRARDFRKAPPQRTRLLKALIPPYEEAAKSYYAAIDASTERQTKALEAGVATARVVRLPVMRLRARSGYAARNVRLS